VTVNATVLGIALTVSLMLSTIMVVVLARPLRLVLSTLCERGEGVSFWVSFTSLMLYLTPLFVTVVRHGGMHLELAPIAEVIRVSLSTAVLGALVALLPVAWQIAHARPRSLATPNQAHTNGFSHEMNRG
jgi:hypothetical protein